jgi:hypothetical protein
MDIKKIQKEIKSNALKEIVEDLDEIVNKVRAQEISYQQGNMEIVGRKHVIQSIALDWTFSKKVK